MEELRLVEPDRNMLREIESYRNEYLDSGIRKIHGCSGLEFHDNINDWLTKVEKGPDLPFMEGRVPFRQYFLVDGKGRILGSIQLRYMLDSYLREYAGHIGYGVRASERRKGYASRMLSLCLDKAREYGLDKVMVTCDEDNMGSRRTIEKNGGVFHGHAIEKEGKTPVRKYWIDLK